MPTTPPACAIVSCLISGDPAPFFEAYAPFPININTAPREVLYAVMANLHLRSADKPDQIVGPALAWTLAERLVADRAGELKLET